MEQLLRVVATISLCERFNRAERTLPDGSMEVTGKSYKYAQFEGGVSPLTCLCRDRQARRVDRPLFRRPLVADSTKPHAVRRTDPRCGYAVCFGTAGDMDFINSIAWARAPAGADRPDYRQQVHRYYAGPLPFLLRDARAGIVGGRRAGRFHPYEEDLGTQIAQIIISTLSTTLRAEAEGSLSRWCTVTAPARDAHVVACARSCRG
ncbi:MAG: hypothetical protein ACLS37_13125 [Alistipes sp.]